MLTIKEAMELPVMNQTKLIAGKAGLNNPIKWVTTVELIEDITRFQEGEFLITTGYGLDTGSEYKKRLLHLIETGKLAGIALYTGFYIKEVPGEVSLAAEQAGLPLIEIPTSINFSAVTKAILEQLANRQIRLLEASLSIHKEMTKLALGNEGLQHVLEKLSELTSSSMFVFDEMYSLSASNVRHSDVRVSSNTVFFREEPFNLREFMTISEKTKDDPFLRYTWHGFPSFLTPVKSGEFIYGYLLMIHEKNHSSEMDEVILEHVSTLIGIEFVKKHAIEETRVRLQGELLEEILRKENLDVHTATRRALRLGFDLSGRQAVIHVKVQGSPRTVEQKDWGKHLYYIVSAQLRKAGIQFLLLPKTNALAALVEVKKNETADEKHLLKDICKQIHTHWASRENSSLAIGIGRTYEDITRLSESGTQAEHAITYSGLLMNKPEIVHFDELGFYHLLIQLEASGLELEDYYRQYLGDLTSGERHRTDLLLTLETYLSQNCHIQQTASMLFIHRHTLKYRLQQIERKTGLSMHHAQDRLNLQLALMAYRFCHTSRY
ncbi:PucR family transcriptional regulator [Alteribacter natronophilus]|uniref:PucR family transcriptional regulator n=1 Tax=Alteribacter natronophilus TaxID=2583810 RepID=UPI00110DBE4E|nr:PucR family transcriptional regulator [Alteribacter natronophilus]TMW73518.1 hypothetical protein FGB90_04250 [Alteribacter natronophilus]